MQQGMFVAVLAILAAHERQSMPISLGSIVHTLIPSPTILVVSSLSNHSHGLAVRPFVGRIRGCLIVISTISMCIQALVGNQHVSWHVASSIGDDCVDDTIAVVSHGLLNDIGRINITWRDSR